ncbi:MAG TPA: potassium channel family protein [Pseudonocardiaceae bacterium]|nr:potassium channel family protein [Pseudonocardiaceae bacterium]
MPLVSRRMSRYLAGSGSMRSAMAVIIWAMCLSVLVGGVIVWIFDRTDFPNAGLGMWWALQTVTTVGYGDVVPTTAFGRVIGAVVMVSSVAFVSVLTAAITSVFVQRARRRFGDDDLPARLDEISSRLDRIDDALRRR